MLYICLENVRIKVKNNIKHSIVSHTMGLCTQILHPWAQRARDGTHFLNVFFNKLSM